MPNEQSFSNLSQAQLEKLHELTFADGIRFEQGEFAITRDALVHYGLHRFSVQQSMAPDELARPQTIQPNEKTSISPRIILTMPDEFMLPPEEVLGYGYEYSGQRATFWLAQRTSSEDLLDSFRRETAADMLKDAKLQGLSHEEALEKLADIGGITLVQFGLVRLKGVLHFAQPDIVNTMNACYAQGLSQDHLHSARKIAMSSSMAIALGVGSETWLAQGGAAKIIQPAFLLGLLAIPAYFSYKLHQAGADSGTLVNDMRNVYQLQTAELIQAITTAYSPAATNADFREIVQGLDIFPDEGPNVPS